MILLYSVLSPKTSKTISPFWFSMDDFIPCCTEKIDTVRREHLWDSSSTFFYFLAHTPLNPSFLLYYGWSLHAPSPGQCLWLCTRPTSLANSRTTLQQCSPLTPAPSMFSSSHDHAPWLISTISSCQTMWWVPWGAQRWISRFQKSPFPIYTLNVACDMRQREPLFSLWGDGRWSWDPMHTQSIGGEFWAISTWSFFWPLFP